MSLSCHRCRRLLTAYVHNELTARARRRIDAHLNGCAECAACYVQQQRAARDFSQEIAGMGVPDAKQLGTIWASVLAELDSQSPSVYRTSHGGQLRYGAVALALVIALIAPTMLVQGSVHAQLPDPPTPLVYTARALMVGSPVPQVSSLAAATADPREGTDRPAMTTILFQSNYAPTPGATDSP